MWDSPVHLLVVLVTVGIFLTFFIPVVRILHRTGHSGWWSLLLFVPLANWIALWIFAYVSWPAVDKFKST
jgi:uncharacterized membrane protein YhaH (DUF805 family)